MKACKKCGSTENGYYAAASNVDGLSHTCKVCARAVSVLWRKRNPEKSKSYQVAYRLAQGDLLREKKTERQYLLSPEGYSTLLAAQNGVCAICQGEETRSRRDGSQRRLAVDHDHSCCPALRSCGKCIRGLLCQNCNQALGHFDDDSNRIRAAIEYLRKWSA